MKSVIRQILKMNKSLKKGKILLSEETRLSLPRSLWRVSFPPPNTEIITCDETCNKILKSMESKWQKLLPLGFLFIVLYCMYMLQ